MYRRIWVVAALIAMTLPCLARASTDRVGAGYSLYPQIDGLVTIRYSAYSFFLEGGLKIEDLDKTRFLLGSKFALRPYEYRGIPLEIGVSAAIKTDVPSGDGGEDTLIHVGSFVGLSTLITDDVSVGVAAYLLGIGLGLDERNYDFLTPVFDITFLF